MMISGNVLHINASYTSVHIAAYCTLITSLRRYFLLFFICIFWPVCNVDEPVLM